MGCLHYYCRCPSRSELLGAARIYSTCGVYPLTATLSSSRGATPKKQPQMSKGGGGVIGSHLRQSGELMASLAGLQIMSLFNLGEEVKTKNDVVLFYKKKRKSALMVALRAWRLLRMFV